MQNLVDLLLTRCQHHGIKQEIFHRLLTIIDTNYIPFFDKMKVCEWTQTPVAEVRGDDEKIRRVSQVFAKQLAIFLLFRFTQSSHQYRDDAELIFMAVLKNKAQNRIICQVPDGDLTFACL